MTGLVKGTVPTVVKATGASNSVAVTGQYFIYDMNRWKDALNGFWMVASDGSGGLGEVFVPFGAGIGSGNTTTFNGVLPLGRPQVDIATNLPFRATSGHWGIHAGITNQTSTWTGYIEFEAVSPIATYSLSTDARLDIYEAF